jgi:5'-3' exonuclease
MIFGFLRSISVLKDEFQMDRIAFCFEHPHLLRRDSYPPYKRKRHTKERTVEEAKAHKEFKLQIHLLQTELLPEIGFKNIFCYDGYESDDIMAAIAADTKEFDETVLVTGDSDLWQCLRENVMIYSPQKRILLTDAWFEREYGIHPRQWSVVKAIAGCAGDEVKGIKGVGEKTALKYLRGGLEIDSAVFQRLVCRESRKIQMRNEKLVELPYKGCPIPEMLEDRVTASRWRYVCDELGMYSIAGRPPISTRKLMSYACR